jgi:L-lactate permease
MDQPSMQPEFLHILFDGIDPPDWSDVLLALLLLLIFTVSMVLLNWRRERPYSTALFLSGGFFSATQVYKENRSYPWMPMIAGASLVFGVLIALGVTAVRRNFVKAQSRSPTIKQRRDMATRHSEFKRDKGA